MHVIILVNSALIDAPFERHDGFVLQLIALNQWHGRGLRRLGLLRCLLVLLGLSLGRLRRLDPRLLEVFGDQVHLELEVVVGLLLGRGLKIFKVQRAQVEMHGIRGLMCFQVIRYLGERIEQSFRRFGGLPEVVHLVGCLTYVLLQAIENASIEVFP